MTTYMPPGSPEYERFIRFKRNLLYWETKRGITRQQLLDHMGVDVNHFDRASKMTREQKIAYLEKMAAFLRIPLSALFAPPPSDYRSPHLDGWRRE